MSISIPDALPILPDSWYRNDNPDTSQLTRALIGFQNYTYALRTRQTPIDTTRWLNSADPNAPKRVWVDSTYTTCELGRYYVPHHRGFARKLNLRFYCVLAHSSCEAVLHVQDEKTGRTATIDLNSTSVSGLAATLTDTFVIDPGSTLRIWTTYTAGGGNRSHVRGFSAYWETLPSIRSDVTIASGWEVPPWQPYYSDGRADHAYTLRWLIRRGNQLVSQYPIQVAAKWWGDWYSSIDATNIGRYRFYVGTKTPSLSIAVCAAGGADCSLVVKLNGSTAATITVSNTSYDWKTTTTLTTGLSNDGENTLDLEVSSGSGNNLRVASVCVWEDSPSAADLQLPGGDAIPSTFTPCHADLVSTRSNIAADITPEGKRVGRKWLVKGLIYLWAKRAPRQLVSDCRFDAFNVATMAATPTDLVSGSSLVQCRYKFMSGINTKMRVRWYARNSDDAAPASGVNLSTVIDPQGSSTPSSAEYYVNSTGAGTLTDEIDFSLYTSDDFTITASTEYELQLSNNCSSGSVRPIVGGVIVEEVPITATTMATL